MITPALWPDDRDATTADLLVTDTAQTLPCGCTVEHDCTHAYHMRQRPELARKLMEHRRNLNPQFNSALKLTEARESAYAGERG